MSISMKNMVPFLLLAGLVLGAAVVLVTLMAFGVIPMTGFKMADLYWPGM